MNDRFKVNGKTGNLGSLVSITRTGSSIAIKSTVHFSKRYLKYLTKKYLKKSQVRDWIRVVASGKDTYQLRYLYINKDEEEGGAGAEVEGEETEQ